MYSNGKRASNARQRTAPQSLPPEQTIRVEFVQVSSQSEKAPSASVASDAESTLERARIEFAGIFDGILKKAKRLGMKAQSARAIARRCIHQPNQLVAKWRSTKKPMKPMPAAALLLLPPYVLVEIINAVLRARGMKEYEP